MLSDNERKVLRIISASLRLYRREPTVAEIMMRSGKKRADVLSVLGSLSTAGYIEWSSHTPDDIRLLKDTDEHLRAPVARRTDYFMD